MDKPPNWLTIVGMAVATMVPSTEARKMLSMIPMVMILKRF